MYQPDNRGIPWKPGFWRHVPWKAIISLVAFAICCIGLAAILLSSHGKEAAIWPCSSVPVPVSVLLSLIVGIANLCLAVALNQGYEVSWWLKAIKGAELRRLQFDLEIQHSLAALLGSSRTINKFAFAATISLIVSVIDGPLIQRATTTKLMTFGTNETIVTVGVSNASFPSDFSGYAGGGIGPDLLMPLFSNVSRAYANKDAIVLPIEGCTENSTCIVNLPAPGFDVSCTNTTVPFDFGNLASAGPVYAITVFNVTVDFGGTEDVDSFSMINVTTLYKPDAACTGHLIQRQCILRLATVRYKVSIINGILTIAPWQLGQNDTIEITRFPSGSIFGGMDVLFTGSVGAGGFETMLGGIYFVTNLLYNSSVSLQAAVTIDTPYLLSASGQAASNYLTSSISTYSNCSMTWEDPTIDLVNTVRELMLRSAVAQSITNVSSVVPQELLAQETRAANAYESHYEFLAITVACMVLQALIIFLLLVGWCKLGRKVSLDAFEIAKALGAPLLRQCNSNSTIDDCLNRIGRMRLKYGALPVDIAILDPSQFPPQLQGHIYQDGRQGEFFADKTPNQDTSPEAERSSFLPQQNNKCLPTKILALHEEGRVDDISAGTLYY